jgi:hypothetical protein
MADHRLTSDAEAIVNDCEPALRGIIRRKLGVTLSPNDGRAENLDAENLLSDLRLVLIESLAKPYTASDGEAIRDIRGYIAKAAYNACSDYLRKKYPYRQSLRNRIHYFLNHSPDPALAIWEDGAGQYLCGYAGWRGRAAALNAERLTELRNNPRAIATEALTAKHLENMKANDWAALLHSIFNWTGQPIELDDLVNIVADLMGIQDAALSIEGDNEDSKGLVDTEPDRGRTPEQEGHWAEFLRHLWAAIRDLGPNHRLAYLLNLTDAEGDIQIFISKGVATISDIGRVLQLTNEHFEKLWRRLQLNDDERTFVQPSASYDERFAVVWKHLPLDDNAIAELIGGARQQVINLRKSARLQLRRLLRSFL